MRGLLFCVLVFAVSCGQPQPTTGLCPNFKAGGECTGATASWCDATTADGTPPATLDCSTVNGTCAFNAELGAWCSVPMGAPCVAQNQTRSQYYYCGDKNGPTSGVACDVDKGCITSSAVCEQGMTQPYCDLDKLVVDCTPWGQPVQRQCKELGAVGCAEGSCVGVPMGGDCGPQMQCIFGMTCNDMTHKCDFEPGYHPAAPQVVTKHGPTLAHPKVMVISYASDPRGAQLEAFTQGLTTSTYWGITTSEYGVGPLTVRNPVHLPDPIPMTMTDDDVNAMITANTTGASPAWGTADENTIYLFLVPPNVPYSDSQGGSCCGAYDGYHSEAQTGNYTVPYAIACACGFFDGTKQTDVDNMTVGASHELIEAATDPYPFTRPAFTGADADHYAWTILTEGEVGDMCEFNPDASFTPDDLPFLVQRTWSNASAAAGLNPCVPAPTAYASASPVLPDVGQLHYFQTVTTRMVKIAVGQTGVVDLPVFTSVPMGQVKVKVYDGLYYFYGGDRNLDMSLDLDTATNGDTLKLSISPSKFDPDLKADIFIVETDFGNGMTSLAMGVVEAP
jgi:hypothetical protein